MRVYWRQPFVSQSELYAQIGVFAGQPNCAMTSCPLVKTPAHHYDVLSYFFYIPTNPFTSSPSVPADVMFPITGCQAPAFGVNEPEGVFATGTDALGTISLAMAPRALERSSSGSGDTYVAQCTLSSPASPWLDGDTLQLSIGLQCWLADVPYHDGTVGGDGAIYFYPTFTLIGPNNEFLQYVLRLYEDKYIPTLPTGADVTDVVEPYGTGTIFCSKLGQSLLHRSIGDAGYANPRPAQGYKRYVATIDNYQLSAAIALINSERKLNWPLDAWRWRLTEFALDAECVACGTTNPRLGFSFNGLEVAATRQGVS